MKKLFLLLYIFLTVSVLAEPFRLQQLPHRELLPSGDVLSLMQDSEGFLWYATLGGICRDDGRQIDVFRSDGEHPDLLGSNKVSCLAESGHHIVIGTFHGAYLLNKNDYSVTRIQKVDDKRVDDVLVTRQGRVFLTANRKIFEFSADLKLENIYASEWKGNAVYVSRLFEDALGRIWATQWSGGLVRLENGQFREAAWPLTVAPTDLADGPQSGYLWVGTVGKGIVLYHADHADVVEQPETGDAVCIDLQPSVDGQWLWMITMQGLQLFKYDGALKSMSVDDIVPEGELVLSRLTLDLKGNLLVAGSVPGPFVLSSDESKQWFSDTVYDDHCAWSFRERQGLMMVCNGEEHTVHAGAQLLPVLVRRHAGGVWTTDGNRLLACTADTVMTCGLFSERPSAIAEDLEGNIWFSTGKAIKKISLPDGNEQVVLNLADVSALAFTPDGSLWMATIYGKLYQYKDGNLRADEYGSNEHGDAVDYLSVDHQARLLIVCDRYVRCYDPMRQTLMQQSRELSQIYAIELQESPEGKRWSTPADSTISTTLPGWMNSWWMWVVYVLLVVIVVVLLVHNIILRRQRKHFLNKIKEEATETVHQTQEEAPERPVETTAALPDNSLNEIEKSFLQKTIAQVEAHLSDDNYSVEQLSKDLCMSRMTFYRKIQAATGQSPTEFVRTIRLKHSVELLREGRLTITEISYATGFSSVSYFSRSFRTMFGVPPTQFMAEFGKTTTADALPFKEMPNWESGMVFSKTPDRL